MVHATCYGNPLIKGVPDGDWFCSPCLASKSDRESKQPSLSCCLCPIKGGALKSTAAKGRDESWAHIVCALLIPEVFFENPDGREGIDCSKIPKRRWEGKCYVCKSRKGCVIDCSEPKCHLAFHVTCGLNEDVCIEYKEGKKETIVAGFCKRDTELWDKVTKKSIISIGRVISYFYGFLMFFLLFAATTDREVQDCCQRRAQKVISSRWAIE